MVMRHEMRATCLLVTLVMGCGHNAISPDGGDIDAKPTPFCRACQLLALEPAIASANQTIHLEGTFAEPAVVQFPGGVSQTATILGPYRATVVVPDTATAGDLILATKGSPGFALPFRRVSFTPEIGSFQAFGGTTTVRAQPAIAAAGNRLYVIGGSDSTGKALTSIEEAVIGADGSVGAFTASPVSLTIGRIGARAKRIGNRLVIVGGGVDRVEIADVGFDGSLTQFINLPAVRLPSARANVALAVIGSYLYALGGSAPETSTLVERASMTSDGSMSAFEAVPDVTTAAGRIYLSAEVIGNYLYVLGGINLQSQNSVERAKIAPDGTLGKFENADGCTLSSGRDRVAIVRIASDLYAVGGQAPSAPFTIEHASIASDGTLGTFSVLSVQMPSSHKDSTGVVIGDYLYVLGGLFGTASVERAPINGPAPLR
jgi:Kelch motif